MFIKRLSDGTLGKDTDINIEDIISTVKRLNKSNVPKLSDDKIKLKLEKEKLHIDKDVKVNIPEIKEVKFTGIIPQFAPYQLCVKNTNMFISAERLLYRLSHARDYELDSLKNATSAQEIDNFFLPSILHLEEIYNSQAEKINNICNFYEAEYNKNRALLYRTDREKKHGYLAITAVPEIIEKYSALQENAIKNNEAQYLKITDKKIEYMYPRDFRQYNIFDTIDDLLELNEIVEDRVFGFITDYGTQDFSLVKVRDLTKSFVYATDIIYNGFQKVMNNKKCNDNKTVYFSKEETTVMKKLFELCQEVKKMQEKLVLELSNIRQLNEDEAGAYCDADDCPVYDRLFALDFYGEDVITYIASDLLWLFDIKKENQ